MGNAEILEKMEPCGQVLTTPEYKYFALQCIYCGSRYSHWSTFMQHLRSLHSILEEHLLDEKEEEFSGVTVPETEEKVNTVIGGELYEEIEIEFIKPTLKSVTQERRAAEVYAALDDTQSNEDYKITASTGNEEEVNQCQIGTDTRREFSERCSFLGGMKLDDRIELRNISAKKINIGDTEVFTLGFVDLCQQHSVFWDKGQNELRHESLTKSDRYKFLPPRLHMLQCHVCERMLRSETTLQVHLLKAHNLGQLPYQCPYCELRFVNTNARQEHEVRAHTKQFRWCCRYCQKGFAVRREMVLHEMVHTGERQHACTHCDRRFRLKIQLRQHVQVVHERQRVYKCSICPKDYARKRQLTDHIRSHLNVRDKVCSVCGKAFNCYQSLYRHKKLHSETKRYACQLCAKRFHQFVGLRIHMKRYHEIVNVFEAADGGG